MKINRPVTNWKLWGVFTLLLFGVSGVTDALAQEQSEAAKGDSLEEIMVTARKREENIQDVAIAMTALSQTEIDRTFARDLKDLSSISPNLVIDDTAQGPGGVAAIYIRGVGVADVEKSFDPAVGVVVDGLFIGANTGSILKSIDIARIEVLRGPQGTQFGRNTIGGVINVERTKPTGVYGAKFRASYGNYDTYGIEGIFNFPLTDSIAVKLSASKHDQRKGYYKNVVSGQSIGSENYESVGVNVLWTPNDSMELEYTFNHENTDQDTPPLLNTGQPQHLFCAVYGYCSPSVDSTITGDRRAVASVALRPPDPNGSIFNVSTTDQLLPTDFNANFNSYTHIVEFRWAINDDYSFDAIYGHWNSSEKVFTDWDGTPEMLYHTDRPADWKQDSLELRMTNGGSDAFSWVAGVFLWKSSFDIRLRSYIGFAAPGLVLDIAQFGYQDTKSRAAFFEGDYRFTDNWTLTVGGRYTKDKKTSRARGFVDTSIPLSGGAPVDFAPGLSGDPKDSWNQFTPKVSVKYQYNDDSMAYASWTNGYRSGGFNSRVNSYSEAITPYNQETVTNYELGIKTETMNKRLRLNADVFWMNYKDKQEEIHLPDTLSGTGQKTVVANAATAEMKGAELELQANVTDNLYVRANVAYLDASYKDFLFDDDGNPATPMVDYSYLKPRRAPKWTGNIDATYEWPVGENSVWARVSYHYIASDYTDFTNAPELRNAPQNLIDASINYDYGTTRFSLFGRNLTNEDGYMIGYDVAGIWSYAATRPPRTWGVEVTFQFGGK